jgi:hypothetical protein
MLRYGPEFRWVLSNGGALLLVPGEHLPWWGGVEPPADGRRIEAQFCWHGQVDPSPAYGQGIPGPLTANRTEVVRRDRLPRALDSWLSSPLHGRRFPQALRYSITMLPRADRNGKERGHSSPALKGRCLLAPLQMKRRSDAAQRTDADR